MRYVLFFDEENKAYNMRHYEGKKLNPDEEVKKINHPNFKRFSEEMLIELCGEDFKDKALYIDLDEGGKPFFNANRYEQAKMEQEEIEQQD